MPIVRSRTIAFYLQLGFILLPTLLLAAVGLFFLQQDRKLVEQDAEERAQAAVAVLARIADAEWQNAMVSTNGAVEFEYDVHGALLGFGLLSPRGGESLEIPKDPAALKTCANSTNISLSSELCRITFLEARHEPVLPDVLCDWVEDSVEYPSILTGKLIEAAASAFGPAIPSRFQTARGRWEAREETRALAALWQNYLVTSSNEYETRILHRGPRIWCVTRITGPAKRFRAVDLNASFVPKIERYIREGLGLPSHLGAVIFMDGRPIARWPSKWKEDTMLAASDPFSAQVAAQVSVIDGDLLYQRQQTRARWIGGIIGGSALAAFIGSVLAFQTFRREQQLSEMKSNFVSSVSHELRAPIASVQLLGEGLQSGRVRDPARQQEYFNFIVQECRRLSGLIQNVLDFSRIERGRRTYHLEPCDPAAIVAQAAKTLEPIIAEHRIRLEQAVESGEALLDGAAICQALVNLLDNALKHSQDNGRVQIGCAFETQAWTFWVEDEGPGIPLSERERIFDRFYRIGSEMTRERTGAGIGLSIVKHIVEGHQGSVEIRSELGRGSRFTISIPKAK